MKYWLFTKNRDDKFDLDVEIRWALLAREVDNGGWRHRVCERSGARRAGRRKALAARSESIVTTARRIGFLRQLDGVGTPGDDLCDCYCGCSAN